jgi:hypothetical protein
VGNDTPDGGRLDPIGWFIGTLHQLLGHDAAAAVIGASSGNKAACLLCRYDRDPTDERRRAVYRALAPTSIGQAAPVPVTGGEGDPR